MSDALEEEQKKSGRRAWFWRFFRIEELEDEWERG
jgi:hypothetical protein